MAGDWIKMRTDLQSHPKIVRILSATRTDKFRVIGGLHAVWSVFDTHSVDGALKGYTPDLLDHVVGWEGLSRAIESVGWLQYDGLETLTLPEFDTHNGQSAKRRAEDQKRKKTERKTSAICPQSVPKTPDKKRTREEKRREEEKKEKKPAASAVTFRWWIDTIPDGEDAIPADHAVYRFADKAGIPPDFVDLAWRGFERKYASEEKRYKDWPTVFRKAVEGNWLKLWWVGDEGYKLTTTGEQLRRVMAA